MPEAAAIRAFNRGFNSWDEVQAYILKNKVGTLTPKQWIKDNPQKALALGVGINNNGNISKGPAAIANTQSAVTAKVGTTPGAPPAAAPPAEKVVPGSGDVDNATEAHDNALESIGIEAANNFRIALRNFGMSGDWDTLEELTAIIAGLPPEVAAQLDPAKLFEEMQTAGSAGLTFMADLERQRQAAATQMDRLARDLGISREVLARDFGISMEQLERDFGLNLDRLGLENARVLRGIAESATSRGLASSGIRNRFEREQGEDFDFSKTGLVNQRGDESTRLTNVESDTTRRLNNQESDAQADNQLLLESITRAGTLGKRDIDDLIAGVPVDFAGRAADLLGQLGTQTEAIMDSPVVKAGIGIQNNPLGEGINAAGTADFFNFYNTSFGPGGDNPVSEFEKLYRANQKKRKKENRIGFNDFLGSHPTIKGFF